MRLRFSRRHFERLTLLGLRFYLLVSLPLLLGMLGLSAVHAARKEEEKLLLLVARRDIEDPLFQESVVLMLPDTRADVVVGLILNKPTRITMHEVFPKERALRDRPDKVYLGGPVDIESPSLIFLAPKAIDRAVHVAGDLYCSFEPRVIAKILENPNEIKEARLFLGRSTWASEQLEDEMEEQSWYTEHEEDSWIFNRKAENLWPALFGREDPGDVVQLNNGPSVSLMAAVSQVSSR